MDKIDRKQWNECQKFERASWGNNITIASGSPELDKQGVYAFEMGMFDSFGNFPLDLGGISVVDLGAGPISLLLRSKNGRRRIAVEPLDYGDVVRNNYSNAGIELVQLPIEDFRTEEIFDEVWMYNVLQHTISPDDCLKIAKSLGKKLRLFEWLDIPPHEGHPHCFTEDYFVRELSLKPGEYRVKTHERSGCYGRAIALTKLLA